MKHGSPVEGAGVDRQVWGRHGIGLSQVGNPLPTAQRATSPPTALPPIAVPSKPGDLPGGRTASHRWARTVPLKVEHLLGQA